ncbi:hypothetical protein KHC23_22795 [Ancylobacter dichloromethanicus]|jgi:hypothetical protein|uniref:Uncharacterized protein n=2 Tax=Ancylobacter dichloromethanicus TaxID=518825 RepID=A0A9W6N184_9HYPH|nr:hypothetical protein [Ancylobacter dichloromethanicus]MBS7556464.1 hypothetical protein [Ancylobacter dichloromethanicus]GLK73767.1 hypothetical protein GCM10017643_38850 [Ancylobacter dichloromethanicus]
MRKPASRVPVSVETDDIPRIALTHGQTIWLMTELGLHHGVSTSTFNYYIKSLRKLGIPFEKGKGQSEGHRHVTYDFEELMELTVALLLRVYGTLPDTVVAGLREFRDDLRPIYRQAYFDTKTKTYPVARVAEHGRNHVAIDGLFLDLNIRYSAGQMIEFGPPKAMSPFEAVTTFARSEVPARSYLPLNVTALAEMIVGRTQVLPSIRRGRGARQAHQS